MLAFEDFLEAADRVLTRDVLTGRAGELLDGIERLRKEALDPACPLNDFTVLRAQLFDAENGDDVLQIAIALKHSLHFAGDRVVLLADDQRIENARGRGERIHRRVDAALGDRAIE